MLRANVAPILLLALSQSALAGAIPEAPGLDAAAAERLARLVLDCVHREYPNKIAHVLNADADVKPPRVLTPAFYGCYDWHSSVHGHWLLARLARRLPAAPFAREARAALAKSLTPANVAGEVAYLSAAGPRHLRAAVRARLAPPALGRAARSGTTRRRRAWSETLGRSRRRPPRGSPSGSRSSPTRSGKGSTPRRRSPSGSSSTGRGRRRDAAWPRRSSSERSSSST